MKEKQRARREIQRNLCAIRKNYLNVAVWIMKQQTVTLNIQPQSPRKKPGCFSYKGVLQDLHLWWWCLALGCKRQRSGGGSKAETNRAEAEIFWSNRQSLTLKCETTNLTLGNEGRKATDFVCEWWKEMWCRQKRTTVKKLHRVFVKRYHSPLVLGPKDKPVIPVCQVSKSCEQREMERF